MKNKVLFSDILQKVNGEVLGTLPVYALGICPLDKPKEGYLSFSQAKKVSQIPEDAMKSSLGAVFVPEELELTEELPFPIIKVTHSLDAMVESIPLFFPKDESDRSIHENCFIHPETKIGKNVSIGAFCSVEKGVVIEDNVTLFPHVVVYPNVSIGKNTTIHSGAIIRERCVVGENSLIQNGAIIGADGFGYYPHKSEGIKRVPQVGNVELSNFVDIGANTCIDRAALGTTSIGQGSKIDNLVQIGHNVIVGAYSILCAAVAIGGSSKIGNRVTLGGTCGVADHVTIADDVRVGGKAGVIANITEKGDYAGYPAGPVIAWKRQMAYISRLPKLFRELKKTK